MAASIAFSHFLGNWIKIIVFRIANPYNILRQISNLPATENIRRDGGMFYFLRVLYRICNPILLSIRIFNPPTLTLLQVFYCDADCKSLY